MWLTDNTVFAAEQLLNQQHPLSGLQDPCLQQVRTFAIQGNNEFVQCLIVGGNHWITISSVGCNPGTINVYDSMNCNKLTSNLKGIVADLLHTSNKKFIVQYKKMQYQIGGNDCGLFSVASACSICNGQDPSTLKYDQNMMRLHLVNAFFKKKLLPFPAKLVRTGKTTVQCSEEVSVYCVCWQPDGGSKMVQCCKCTE